MDRESLRRQARELIRDRPLGGPLFGEYCAKIEYAEDDGPAGRATGEEELRKAREMIKSRPLGGPLFGEYEPTIELAEDGEPGERA